MSRRRSRLSGRVSECGRDRLARRCCSLSTIRRAALAGQGITMLPVLYQYSGFGSRADDEDPTAIEDDDEPLTEDGDGGSIPLGWAVHALMSTKARLAWLLSAAYRWLVSSAPAPRGLSFDRHEPSLGGRAAPSLAPQDDEEQDEEEEEEEEPAARHRDCGRGAAGDCRDLLLLALHLFGGHRRRAG